jgi:hypothetical protein
MAAGVLDRRGSTRATLCNSDPTEEACWPQAGEELEKLAPITRSEIRIRIISPG